MRDVYPLRFLLAEHRGKLLENICKPLLQIPVKFINEDVGPMINIIRGDYWSRTWVFREIIRVRSVTSFCSSDNLQWEDIQKAMTVFKGLRLLCSILPKAFKAYCPE